MTWAVVTVAAAGVDAISGMLCTLDSKVVSGTGLVGLAVSQSSSSGSFAHLVKMSSIAEGSSELQLVQALGLSGERALEGVEVWPQASSLAWLQQLLQPGQG